MLDKWREAYRHFPILPLTLLALKGRDIPKAVTLDQKMVEAVVMDSTQETLIVLFNWGNTPVSDLNIKLPNTRNYNQAISNVPGTVSGLKTQPQLIEFTLSTLQYVEVIQVFYRKVKLPPTGKTQKGTKTIGNQ